MVKINKRLLPIKAHFLCFMAAMGPILPQLAVIGKQIGIAPEVMGYIMSVLPILYVLAKPLFGYVADYFVSLRKYIFMGLIIVMTLAYGGFYFVPTTMTEHAVPINVDNENFEITLNSKGLLPCHEQLLPRDALCSFTRLAQCATASPAPDTTIFEALITNTDVLPNHNLSQNFNDNQHICRLSAQALSINQSQFSANCSMAPPATNCIYGSLSFWLFVCMLFIGTIGFNVTNSISDAICFDMLGEDEESKYGAQRVWGTVGFGLTALISGVIVNLWTDDPVKSLTPALVIMFIFSGFDLLSVSKLKMPQLSSSESIIKDVCTLVSHPAILVFLVFVVISGILDSFIAYFLFWHLEDVAAQTGYTSQIKLIEGLVVAAECLAGEVPFFFYSGKIIKKLGYVHCMSMCFFFYSIRFGLISWIPNPWYLVVVELFFQGVTYALCYTSIVAYASAVAPPGTSATVQGIMAGMDDGLGFSIGSLIGGFMFKFYGGRRSFLYISIVAMCTCIAHILVRPTSRKRQYLPKSGYQAPKDQQLEQVDDDDNEVGKEMQVMVK